MNYDSVELGITLNTPYVLFGYILIKEKKKEKRLSNMANFDILNTNISKHFSIVLSSLLLLLLLFIIYLFFMSKRCHQPPDTLENAFKR